MNNRQAISTCPSFCLVVILFAATLTASAQHSIHLTSNQSKYTPGDTIYLKAYFLDSRRKGVPGKHLMSVHLIDNKGVAILAIRFNILAGIGNNQFVLPHSATEGYYNIVGYMSPVEESSFGYTTTRTIAVVEKNTIVSASNDSTESVMPSGQRTEAVINVPAAELGRRQSLKTEVQLRDAQGKPVTGEFSFCVSNNNILRDDDIRQHWQHKLASDEESPVRLDNAVGAAFNVFQKTGRVFNAESGEPVPDNTQVLFYLQNAQWYHQTFTLNGGMVKLNLPQFSGTDELFYLAETPREKIISVRIEWEQHELPAFRPAPLHQLSSTPDTYATFIANKRRISRSYNAYSPIDTTLQNAREREDFDLVEADNFYRPEQYVNFKTLAEMILEVIPALYHRKHGETEIVRLNIADPITATTNPVYAIDGKLTTSTKYFLSISPSEMEYIALVKDPKKLLPLRLLGKNGIVIVKTKSGKFAPPADDPSKVVQGLTPSIEFPKIEFGTRGAKGPVFRSTLHWIPSIVTDKDGRATIEFSTTDDVGEMIIEVRGITSAGEAFLSHLPILVK